MRTWFFGFVFLVAAALAASMDVTASPPTAKGQTAGKSAVKGGSTERRAILDALRQELKAWTKLDVVFVVQYLREQEGWAWVAALPQSRDGKNKYEPVEALLHKDARGWKVLEMRPGGAECEEDPNCADDTRYFGKLKSRFSAAPGDIFPK